MAWIPVDQPRDRGEENTDRYSTHQYSRHALVNLPETRQTRWSEPLTAETMKKCIWVNPELVAQIEFLEWTDNDHLRHAKFARLREDNDVGTVVKEHGGEG
jgi:ATP-dependent DNA ligase